MTISDSSDVCSQVIRLTTKRRETEVVEVNPLDTKDGDENEFEDKSPSGSVMEV